MYCVWDWKFHKENEKSSVCGIGSSTRRMKSVVCLGLEVPQGG